MRIRIISLITVQTMVACANLTSVTQFSTTSLAATKKFEEINYTFSQHCIDRCEIIAIDSFKIYREVECHCEKYKRADSVTQSIVHAVVGYFDGLEKLSKNDLTSYHIDPLRKAVQEEDLGEFRVKKEEADAYATLTSLLLRSFGEGYRQHKIKAYIREANAPIQTLLSTLNFIESKNLEGLLAFKKERLFDHYRNLLKSKLNDYERQKATEDYYRGLREIILLDKKISTYSRSLIAVGKGHQKLFDNLNKISGKELKSTLTPFAHDIEDLISEFNKLRNK